MKKVMYLFVIVLFSQMFFSCSNEIEEEIDFIENIQNTEGDWGDEIDDNTGDEDEENNNEGEENNGNG